MRLLISQMLAIVVISLCLVESVMPQSCGAGPGSDEIPSRPGGGQKKASETPKEWNDFKKWPWMVAIFNSDRWDEVCGGALIDNRHVLTAAHCFQNNHDPLLYNVEVGLRSLNTSSLRHQVRDIYVHENYGPYGEQDDIAIVLIDPLSPDDESPVCPPQNEIIIAEDPVTSLGWGREHVEGKIPERLEVQRMRVVDYQECNKIYSYSLSHPTDPTEKFICVGVDEEEDEVCHGLYGSVLLRQNDKGLWVLLGVVILGSECASPGRPLIYTDVTTYMGWIDEYLGLEEGKK